MTIQILVFGIYFLAIFLIGWYSLRATTSDADYWVADGKLGWLVGGSTMAATHASAGTFIGTVGVIYTVGWSFTWVLLTIPLAYWFMVAFVAPRFTRVRELTLPAYLERRYASKLVRGLGGAIILVATVVYIQAQIVTGGIISNVVFGVSPEVGMVVVTVILVAYTLFGGMLAIAYTDFLQMIIMVVGVVVSVPLAISHFGSLGGMNSVLLAVRPTTFQWGGMPAALLITMAMAFFLGGIATPEKLVRLYAMKDMRTIRRGVLLTIFLVTFINLLVFMLGLAAMAFFPMLPSGDLAMPLIAKEILPPLVGTLMLAAVVSAVMSTVDSLLLVAGSALSEDIFRNLLFQNASKTSSLWVARLGILIVGAIPVILILAGYSKGELIQFIVVLYTAIIAASFVVPVVGGIVWRRATEWGAIASMFGGALTTGIWKAYGDPDIFPVLPGFIVSLVLYVAVSLATRPPDPAAWKPYFENESG